MEIWVRKSFADWDWEDTAFTILAVAALFFLVTLGVFIFAQKDVDYYYLHKEDNDVVCVSAHWTWHPDESAWCTSEPEQALRFLKYANDHMRGTVPDPKKFIIEESEKPSDKGETQ